MSKILHFSFRIHVMRAGLTGIISRALFFDGSVLYQLTLEWENLHHIPQLVRVGKVSYQIHPSALTIAFKHWKTGIQFLPQL